MQSLTSPTHVKSSDHAALTANSSPISGHPLPNIELSNRANVFGTAGDYLGLYALYSGLVTFFGGLVINTFSENPSNVERGKCFMVTGAALVGTGIVGFLQYIKRTNEAPKLKSD